MHLIKGHTAMHAEKVNLMRYGLCLQGGNDSNDRAKVTSSECKPMPDPVAAILLYTGLSPHHSKLTERTESSSILLSDANTKPSAESQQHASSHSMYVSQIVVAAHCTPSRGLGSCLGVPRDSLAHCKAGFSCCKETALRHMG